MLSSGFEFAIPAIRRLQTYALDGMVIVLGDVRFIYTYSRPEK
jgi:hypothetical protein